MDVEPKKELESEKVDADLLGAAMIEALRPRTAEIRAAIQIVRRVVPELFEDWGGAYLSRLLATGQIPPAEIDSVVLEFCHALKIKEKTDRPVGNQRSYFVAILKRRCLGHRGIPWENV